MLEFFFEKSSIPIFIENSNRIIIKANKAFANLFDKNIEDVIGIKASTIFSAFAFLNSITPNYNGEPTKFPKHYTIRHKDNIYILKGIPFNDENNQLLTFYILIETDNAKFLIDHSKTNTNFSRLITGFSHEFNNILTPIIGYTDLELKRTNDKKNKKALKEIQKAAYKASDIITSLLMCSGKFLNERIPININHEISGSKEVLYTSLNTHNSKDIKIDFNLSDNIGIIKMDKYQFNIMLANIFNNSIEAIEKKGEIIISTYNMNILDKHFVCLEIYDTGMGIPKGIKKYIFEPFFTTKAKNKHKGLGLSEVKGIVEQNNGYIDVESINNRGTKIRIFFPRMGPLEKSKNNNLNIDIYPQNNAILLVDDDISITEVIEEFLNGLGYNITKFSDPSLAIEWFEKNHEKINILITDIVLPKMNGISLYNKLHEKNNKLKVLFISGYPDTISNIKKELGNKPFLKKPFPLKDLAIKLKEIIN